MKNAEASADSRMPGWVVNESSLCRKGQRIWKVWSEIGTAVGAPVFLALAGRLQDGQMHSRCVVAVHGK